MLAGMDEWIELGEFARWRVVVCVVGTLLLWTSGRLTESKTFRIAVGTALWMVTFSAFLGSFIFRRLPGEKFLVPMMVGFGGLSFGIVHAFLPTVYEALQKYFVWYMVASGMTGFLITYYLDDHHSKRQKMVFNVVLKVLSMSMIVLSCPTSTLGIAVFGLVLISQHFALPVFSFGFNKYLESAENGRNRRKMGVERRGGKCASVVPFDDRIGFNYEGGDCAIVKSGWMLHPNLRTPVKIGGAEYRGLLREGYVPDFYNGILRRV